MTARVNVVELRSVKPVAISMPSTPNPTPMIAVSSGSPAVSSEPNVMIKMMAATARPSPSVPPCWNGSWDASPPNSTRSPAACAARLAANSRFLSVEVMSVAFTR